MARVNTIHNTPEGVWYKGVNTGQDAWNLKVPGGNFMLQTYWHDGVKAAHPEPGWRFYPLGGGLEVGFPDLDAVKAAAWKQAQQYLSTNLAWLNANDPTPGGNIWEAFPIEFQQYASEPVCLVASPPSDETVELLSEAVVSIAEAVKAGDLDEFEQVNKILVALGMPPIPEDA